MKLTAYSETGKLYIKYKNDVFNVESDNDEELCILINRFADSNDLSQFSEVEKVTINDVLISIGYDKNKPHIFYSNVAIGNMQSIKKTEFEKTDKPKIFFLSNLNIDGITSYFSNIKQSVGIIDFIDHYLVTPLMDDNVPCLDCVIKRFVQLNHETYKYLSLFQNAKMEKTEEYLFEYLYNLAHIQITSNSREAIIINKWTHRTIYSEVIPVEGCPKCFSMERKHLNSISIDKYAGVLQDSGKRAFSPDSALTMLINSVKPLGPVLGLDESTAVDKLEIPVYHSLAARNRNAATSPHNGGKGLDSVQAKCSAIGEAIERYSSELFGNEYVITSSYEKLIENKNAALNPMELLPDENYTYPYKPNKEYEWVESKRLHDSKDILIPANIVFFEYRPKRIEMQFMPQSTTGLASGLTIEDAILQGLIEIIERDSYLVYFRKQLNCANVILDNIYNSNLKNLILRLNGKGIICHLKFLKNETDVIVIHCVSEDKSGEFPVFTHGVGASTNPEIACIRAITEAVQMRVSQIEVANNYKQFAGNMDYIPYMTWGRGEKNRIGTLLTESSDSKINLSEIISMEFDSISDEIFYIENQLHTRGYETYVCNLSRDDCCCKVVRVVVPGYQDGIYTNLHKTKRFTELPLFLNQNCREGLFEEGIFT